MRTEILKKLRAQVNINDHIVGAVAGSGMTVKCAAMGGADLILALSAGKFRVMGRGSYASYFCYGNSNDIVMEMGSKELLPIIRDIPVLFGLFANDPTIHVYDYLKEIKKTGFTGVVNYPTISLIDGEFRKALEEEGNTFDNEVEAIHLAHYMGLFTMAFVTNELEAKQMIEAGADIICVHLGLTKGGLVGAKKYLSIYEAMKVSEKIFKVCDDLNPEVIKTIYAGPANTPIDMQFLYKNTKCQGYIGGSTFDRIPTERAIINTIRAFKSNDSFDEEDTMTKLLNDELNSQNYVQFVKEYINEHYDKEILLGDIALVIHVTPSYLSTKFKQETGCSFTEYLIRFRMEKAKELLLNGNDSCKQVAIKVGYKDYAQFSKMYLKYMGENPSAIRNKKNR